METTIEVAGLRKRFGPALALDGMTFTVSPGQVTAFIGPNGAGKSTTMRMMGELQDSAGHVVIVGRGQVIADTSVADLLASVSGDRVMLRTAAGIQAAAVLKRAGATVAVTGPDALTISGLPAERSWRCCRKAPSRSRR